MRLPDLKPGCPSITEKVPPRWVGALRFCPWWGIRNAERALPVDSIPHFILQRSNRQLRKFGGYFFVLSKFVSVAFQVLFEIILSLFSMTNAPKLPHRHLLRWGALHNVSMLIVMLDLKSMEKWFSKRLILSIGRLLVFHQTL